MTKISYTGSDCRRPILEGIKEITDVVGATLGPRGRNVFIEQSFGAPKITKDGVTVAKSFESKKNKLGVDLLKDVANKANDTAGDGTTTATVLAGALSSEGVKMVEAGANPMDVKRGIEKATSTAIEFIKSISNTIQSNSEIAQVATISANNDSDIGNKIAEAIEKVGKNGVITVEEANKSDDFEVEVVEGMNFDRGYLSPYFITNAEKQICEFENPYILLVENKISGFQQLVPTLEAVAQSGKPLVIVAEDLENEALATLIVNKLRGGLKVAAVKAPAFGDRRKAMLQDISILTKSQVVSEDLGHKLENVTLDWLGTAKKVVITKDDTTIIDGAGDESDIKTRCSEIQLEIENTTSDYEREKLEERLAKLSGGVAILKVGGVTEVEVKEKKDRVEDAYHATKAAIEEGTVCGGGCALLYASNALETLKGSNEDEQVGINIVRKALSAPIRKILSNAGLDGALIVARLLEENDKSKIYDAQGLDYVDAYNAGIIDPTKVVRSALQAASSIASLVITAEAMIIEDPEEENNAGGAAGGMPAMGGGMPAMGGF